MSIKKISANIGDLSIEGLEPGKYLFDLSVFQLIDGSDVRVKVGIIKASLAAHEARRSDVKKAICITGAQHGDEWTGPYVCHELYKAINAEDAKHDIILVPIANPLAFRESARVSSIDSIDMNRIYGSGKKRKPTEHLANDIFENVYLRSDILIDIHSGGPGEYCLLAQAASRGGLDLAIDLGFKTILKTPKHSFSLGAMFENAGRTALTIECGKAREINMETAGVLIEHLLALTSYRPVDMRSSIDDGGLPTQSEAASPETLIYDNATLIGSPTYGVFTSAVELGVDIEKGEIIGSVAELMSDKVIDVASPVSGKLVYLRREPFVGKNESLAHVVSQAL